MHPSPPLAPMVFGAPIWVQGFVYYSGACAVISAVTTLFWVKIVRPLSHAILTLQAFVPAIPNLIEMQKQFEPNGGGSLRDRVDYIAGKAEHAEEVAIASAAKQIEDANALAALTAENRAEITRQIEEFRAHIVEINQKEIAMLADQSAHLGVLPLAAASDRGIVPREPGDEPPPEGSK